jgi:hypothetical protein
LASSTQRPSDESAKPLDRTEVATLSPSGVVLQSDAVNKGLEKALRIIKTAPMTRARRGIAAPIVLPAFQV